ncbi:MAG: class I tRNA ligase family protein [Legionellaceae bacterium]|nr:class I tRNA ligase family protein [Legionellaceae bacterium]
MTYQLFSALDCTQTAYDLHYFPLDFGDAPVHGMLCNVEPSARSRVHNHIEVEFFFFLSGHGVVHVDKEEVNVSAGMGIRIAAFSNHIVENKSESEPLHFISCYWENPTPEIEEVAIVVPEETTLVFATPPTPNGDLHLGHLSGPYLAADIYRRYVSESGASAYYATGQDDHQTYMVTKAKAEHSEPQKVADKYAQRIRTTLDGYGVQLDYFIEPNKNEAYSQFVKRIFMTLYNAGYIVEKEEPAAFSADSKRYLNEAFIRGKCPYCQRESDGNACEECGRPNRCVDMTEAYERLTGQPVISKTCKRLYFRMSLLNDALSEYIKSTPMSAHALSVSQKMMTDGLPDICVSHINTWGIQVPLPQYHDQIIYVWFEMAASYLWAALNLAPDDIKDEMDKIKWFYNRENTRVVHFYGFDNTYYHTLLFPAVYFALGGLNPPSAHVVNELLDLDGSKFSTSRGHLIWGRDLLHTAPADYIRWFLSEVRPEGVRSNFKLSSFSRSVNQLFSVVLKEWTVGLTDCIALNFNNAIPEPGAWTSEQRRFYNALLFFRHQTLENYAIDSFSLRAVTKTLNDLADAALDFQTTQIQYFDKAYLSDNLRTTLALSVLAVKIFALLARPIIPTISVNLLSYIGLSRDVSLTDITFVSSQTQLKIKELPHFIALDEHDILAQLQHLKDHSLIEA